MRCVRLKYDAVSDSLTNVQFASPLEGINVVIKENVWKNTG